MRKGFVLLLILAGLVLADCTIHKKTRYNIPADIRGEQKEELLANLETGRHLYEHNCSKCHGIFTKGKDGIPNFTEKQIDMYTAYAIRRDPTNHAAAANMSSEQLHEVFMFLKFRKRAQESTK